jgi:hypothetical protein
MGSGDLDSLPFVIGAVVRNGKVYLEILSRNMGVITIPPINVYIPVDPKHGILICCSRRFCLVICPDPPAKVGSIEFI